jgi:hypothetical protein
MTAAKQIVAYLAALHAGDSGGRLVELRWRTPRGMARAFYPASAVADIAARAVRLGEVTDVYAGVVARWRPAGTLADVAGGARVAWADCDSPQSVAALAAFTPAPSLLVASGSPGHRHAYWLLDRPLTVAAIQVINRRLALALGADAACAEPARILRLPGTRNHKTCPPRPVVLEHLNAGARVSPGALTAGLPPAPAAPHDCGRRIEQRTRDPLRAVSPEVYVPILTGQAVPAGRKVRCPLHDDRVPSLHVYPDADRGWFCFGCRRGGSIYDLAALLWGIPPRGHGFVVLRRRLAAVLDREA